MCDPRVAVEKALAGWREWRNIQKCLLRKLSKIPDGEVKVRTRECGNRAAKGVVRVSI
jgi:hypothetical protein